MPRASRCVTGRLCSFVIECAPSASSAESSQDESFETPPAVVCAIDKSNADVAAFAAVCYPVHADGFAATGAVCLAVRADLLAAAVQPLPSVSPFALTPPSLPKPFVTPFTQTFQPLPALTPPPVYQPPVSLSAPTFAPPAVPMYEALTLSVFDLMRVPIPEALLLSLTVPPSVELLEPPRAFLSLRQMRRITCCRLSQAHRYSYSRVCFSSITPIIVSSQISSSIALILISSPTSQPTAPRLVRVNDEKWQPPVKPFADLLPQ